MVFFVQYVFKQPMIFLSMKCDCCTNLYQRCEQKIPSFLLVGRRFAEQEMYVVIVKILQNFRLEWKHKDLGQKYQILMVPDAPVDITFHKKY